MTDTLVECPLCESPYCYMIVNEGVAAWSCLSCGYFTNSNFMKNTEYVKAYEQTLTRLYVDIKKIDDTGLVWYPRVVDLTQDGKGIIFVNGTTAENWTWTFAPAILVPKIEKDKFKDKSGKHLLYKTDMHNAKHFKKNEFALAVNELEVI